MKGHNITVNIEKPEDEENRLSDCDLPSGEVPGVEMQAIQKTQTPSPKNGPVSSANVLPDTTSISSREVNPFTFCHEHLSAPPSPKGTENRHHAFNNLLALPTTKTPASISPRILRRTLSARGANEISTLRIPKITNGANSAPVEICGDSISVVNVPAPQDATSKHLPQHGLSIVMSGIYALFILMFGTVVYINDQQREHKIYSEIFNSILTFLGIIWLTIFHIDLHLYKREVLKELKEREDVMQEAAERFSTATEFIINSGYRYATADETEKEKSPPYRFLQGRHSGSFYLKIGSAAFCFGYLIYQGLQLGKHILNFVDHEKKLYNCQSTSSIVLHILSPIYSFYQLFITFKYSNIVINRYKALARFGIMHLIATCMCNWFSTILEEAVADYTHRSSNITGNFSEFDIASFHIIVQKKMPSINPFHCSADSVLSTRSMSAIPYLYPFAIEYNLLLAGVWFIVWQNIGKEHSNADPYHLRHTISMDEYGSDEIAYQSNLVISADCHSANKGLFGGLFLLFTIIVTVIVFFVAMTTEGYEENAISIHTGQEGFLTLIGMLAVCIAFYQIRKLDRSEHPITLLDDVLLFIPLPFYFVHGIMSVMAEYANENYIRLAVHILVTVQVIIQTPFIIDGLRRCSQSQTLRYKKPGRELLTFLIILNLTVWVVNTFELKSVEHYHGQEEYFGDLVWMFIGHTTLPFMLFYRFHSSVCLADMWKSAYEKET